jgi:DNA repair photolyase
MIAGNWPHPALIEPNNFVFKSLSCWSYNIAVGCNHACRFCYVPDASTNKMAPKLAPLGVRDPDEQWGDYVFLRQWDEEAFRASLRRAEKKPLADLNLDGNRAVMLCTTTDPYQTLSRHDSPTGRIVEGKEVAEENGHCAKLVRRALELILTESTLNVRILTRSPLARRDFEIMAAFGPRLLFGMSIPTLNNRLARIYEPKAPAPTRRLETLQEAKAAGLHVYAAVAPVYPECDGDDMLATIRAIKELDPVTIFMEPVNIRADNVRRISEHAASLGEKLRTEVFETPARWAEYAFGQLLIFEKLALASGVHPGTLHLWPDKQLKKHAIRISQHAAGWLDGHWAKISTWPK